MSVRKIIIEKGKTSRPGIAEEWIRKSYSVEAEVPESYTRETIEEMRRDLEQMIDGWLSEAPTPAEAEILKLDIESLPWQRRDKTPCKPGDWGWLFGPESVVGPPEGSEPLIVLLDKHGGKVELPPYEITYSKDRAFIQRRPLKSSSNPHERMDTALKNIHSAAGRMGLKK